MFPQAGNYFPQTGNYSPKAGNYSPQAGDYFPILVIIPLRLVITPMTERVQFSLVAAITLRQTLAITGPANTGKFETVKDYANVS